MTFTFGASSIVLPQPSFSDTESLNISRVARETRGKKQIIFRDPIWPSSRMMTWRFEDLTQVLYDDLLTFLQESIGYEITVLDYRGRNLSGVITNPQTEASEHSGYTIELDFEGNLI